MSSTPRSKRSSTTRPTLTTIVLPLYVPLLVHVVPRLTIANQIANPSVPSLYEDALVYETGSAVTASGALSAYSGKKTGRSPSDKRIVREPSSEKEIWWGPVNKEMSPDVRHHLFTRLCFP